MKAKIGAVFLISMIALAGTGAAYALWYEDLYLYVDIYTGDVDVEWSLYDYYDEGDDKQISDIEAEIIATGDPDLNILRVWIYNAYPCVDYYVYFVENDAYMKQIKYQ